MVHFNLLRVGSFFPPLWMKSGRIPGSVSWSSDEQSTWDILSLQVMVSDQELKYSVQGNNKNYQNFVWHPLLPCLSSLASSPFPVSCPPSLLILASVESSETLPLPSDSLEWQHPGDSLPACLTSRPGYYLSSWLAVGLSSIPGIQQDLCTAPFVPSAALFDRL